ncbi:endonuclease Q family protein [Pseudalkalibacillus berkeleyi]|uniref:Endonuclease Q family protein n=1 Tax=Pseudalkalibacillus berkeleyi TaxID=1069813 RepID=A0ABS9H186_9BACL|nr:endonuclease Q family protein [Pseudalkalibacillus berkeleyi]MCF6137661.1 endonuclease Q family protein [Pseudalkalibacillus berkeleyi]
MIDVFADLHIHLGSTREGAPVKISASKQLTLKRILDYSLNVKGIQMIGIIDCQVPAVLDEIEDMVKLKQLTEHEDGGLIANEACIIMGSEIEVYDESCSGPIHILAYFPYIEQMRQFSGWLKERMTNLNLSSQRYYGSAIELQEKVKQLGGMFIIAHAFTPFKSLYGKGVSSSLTEVFNSSLIDGIELGLSADTRMADQIRELAVFPFLTNSDAHSLEKIGREYQRIRVDDLSFKELEYALKSRGGRLIHQNYGLHPQLGKYYQTCCSKCGSTTNVETTNRCALCKGRIVKGVSNRVQELADGGKGSMPERPSYIHHTPLEFIPGLGKMTLKKLRTRFGTDMEIIHLTDQEQLKTVLSDELVERIIQARSGEMKIKPGGAGQYGKLMS